MATKVIGWIVSILLILLGAIFAAMAIGSLATAVSMLSKMLLFLGSVLTLGAGFFVANPVLKRFLPTKLQGRALRGAGIVLLPVLAIGVVISSFIVTEGANKNATVADAKLDQPAADAPAARSPADQKKLEEAAAVISDMRYMFFRKEKTLTEQQKAILVNTAMAAVAMSKFEKNTLFDCKRTNEALDQFASMNAKAELMGKMFKKDASKVVYTAFSDGKKVYELPDRAAIVILTGTVDEAMKLYSAAHHTTMDQLSGNETYYNYKLGHASDNMLKLGAHLEDLADAKKIPKTAPIPNGTVACLAELVSSVKPIYTL